MAASLEYEISRLKRVELDALAASGSPEEQSAVANEISRRERRRAAARSAAPILNMPAKLKKRQGRR